MYDASEVFPNGFHPAADVCSEDARTLATFVTRTAAGGVKYFITDFGLSTRLEDGNYRRVLGLHCQDRTVPELSDTKSYDPFLVDIYTLGNVFKENFIDVSMLRVQTRPRFN